MLAALARLSFQSPSGRAIRGLHTSRTGGVYAEEGITRPILPLAVQRPVGGVFKAGQPAYLCASASATAVLLARRQIEQHLAADSQFLRFVILGRSVLHDVPLTAGSNCVPAQAAELGARPFVRVPLL